MKKLASRIVIRSGTAEALHQQISIALAAMVLAAVSRMVDRVAVASLRAGGSYQAGRMRQGGW